MPVNMVDSMGLRRNGERVGESLTWTLTLTPTSHFRAPPPLPQLGQSTLAGGSGMEPGGAATFLRQNTLGLEKDGLPCSE